MKRYDNIINNLKSLQNSEKDFIDYVNKRLFDGNYIINDNKIYFLLNCEEFKSSETIINLLNKSLEIRKVHREKVHRAFFSIKTPGDLALLIGYSKKRDVSKIYNAVSNAHYNIFYIPKKSGGFREISAPDNYLLLIQQRLNYILNIIYKPKVAAHGFILQKSILTNAVRHVGKKNILNLDIKDFFPSVNFGRVRGLFLNHPYAVPEKIATLIAKICCYNNKLPQGAATSPIITNMICQRLDQKLTLLAKNYCCTYTRYADDMTFSNTGKMFSSDFVDLIEKIVNEEGFELNKKKIKHMNRHNRHEVTGIKVNQKLNIDRKYIRTIRAILHCWEYKGAEVAKDIYARKYNKYRLIGVPDFVNSVRGRIEFIGYVRTWNDKIYVNLKNKFEKLKTLSNIFNM